MSEFAKPRLHLPLDVGGRHHDVELAREIVDLCLCDLHRSRSGLRIMGKAKRRLATLLRHSGRPRISRTAVCWCGRRDLNPHDLRHEILSLACLPVPPRPHGRGTSSRRPNLGEPGAPVNREGHPAGYAAAPAIPAAFQHNDVLTVSA